MLHCFDPIRTLTFWAILVRLSLAVVCGGVIGAERETKRRPAGFRTHILICLGAAITTLTSQYLLLSLHLFTDVARLGAQVISGIGFIGAGTIIVTRDKRVKGLTTAAGLWAAAIIGLACCASAASRSKVSRSAASRTPTRPTRRTTTARSSPSTAAPRCGPATCATIWLRCRTFWLSRKCEPNRKQGRTPYGVRPCYIFNSRC